MFEQSLISGRGRTAKRWTVMLSAAGQFVVVGVCILIPLAFTERMPVARLDLVPRPYLRPRAVKIVDVRHEARAAVRPATSHALFAPVAIHPIAQISDVPAPQVDSSAPVGDDVVGLPFAIGNPTTAIATPAPDQKPVDTHVAGPPKPAVPAPAPQKPVVVSQGVQQAKAIRQPKPAYPQLARIARVQGRVRLICVIARDGTIQDLRVLEGHPLLVQAAADAVRQWIYQPTLLNGKPVEVIAPIEVVFTLSGGN